MSDEVGHIEVMCNVQKTIIHFQIFWLHKELMESEQVKVSKSGNVRLKNISHKATHAPGETRPIVEKYKTRHGFVGFQISCCSEVGGIVGISASKSIQMWKRARYGP